MVLWASTDKNMKVFTIVIVILTVIFGLSAHHFFPVKQEVQPAKDISVELSIGGEIHVYKAPADSSIHIIANDDMYLTDIQVLPHSNQNTAILATSTKPQKYGKPTNTSTAASSP
jgi:hypothetical protein